MLEVQPTRFQVAVSGSKKFLIIRCLVTDATNIELPWKLGQTVLALDTPRKHSKKDLWLDAKVIKINKKKNAALIHFQGHNHRYDFYATPTSTRVCLPNKTMPRTPPSIVEKQTDLKLKKPVRRDIYKNRGDEEEAKNSGRTARQRKVPARYDSSDFINTSQDECEEELKQDKLISKTIDWCLKEKKGPAAGRDAILVTSVGAAAAAKMFPEVSRRFENLKARERRNHKKMEQLKKANKAKQYRQAKRLHEQTNPPDAPPIASSSGNLKHGNMTAMDKLTEAAHQRIAKKRRMNDNSSLSNAERLDRALERAAAAEKEAEVLRIKLDSISKIVGMLTTSVLDTKH